MKRGLKAIKVPSSNTSSIEVATIAPMKRGLKARVQVSRLPCNMQGSNHCPDEKGTERHCPVDKL